MGKCSFQVGKLRLSAMTRASWPFHNVKSVVPPELRFPLLKWLSGGQGPVAQIPN